MNPTINQLHQPSIDHRIDFDVKLPTLSLTELRNKEADLLYRFVAHHE